MWRCAPLLPWRVQCHVCVCAALAAGSGGSGRYLASCLSRFPLPAPRVPRCVWRAVLSGCPLPSLAGTPLHAVCAFRALGPVALPVVPACPPRVCALALSRCPPPPPGGVACASRVVPALGAGRAVPRGPCPSACPAPVPCTVWRAWGRSGPVPFPPYLAWGCGGGGRASPGGVPSTVAWGVWGHALPLPRLPVHWAGCRGPRSTCCGRGRAGVGVLLCPCGGCAPRGGSVAFICWGAGWGGGGGRRTPRLCGRGGACRAGGRSASFRPSAFPGQATKRASLALCCPWGAWPPIPLRFVLTRLLWVRSVRRPGAQARACLFFAAPMGAGGWGGGAGRTPAPLSGGGDHPPCLGGWGPGPPRLAGQWGGVGGGGVAPRPPCSPPGRRPAVLHPGPLRVADAFPSRVRVRSGLKRCPGVGGGEGRPVDRSPGGPSRPEPPPCHPGVGCGYGSVIWGAASFLFRCARCSGMPVWGRGSRSSRRSPYRVAVPSGGGGAPPALGGRRAAPVAPQLGWMRGGGWGGRPSARSRACVGGGGGSRGGPLVPWRRLLTAGGGGGMAVLAPGASHWLGGRALPPPPST